MPSHFSKLAMDFLTQVLILLFAIVLVLEYLKVVYECVRRVNVKSVTSQKKQLTKTTCVNVLKVKQAPGPLPWPIIGNLDLLGQYEVPFEGFTELSKKFGDVYSLTLGTTRCLVVNNLNLIREVLNENGRHFGGRPDFIRYHKLFGGDRNNSLALCDWSNLQQKRRNLARKHCSPRNSSSFFEKMSEVGCFELQEFMEKLKEELTPGVEYHLKPLVMQTCMNMFSQYMSSTRFDYEDKVFQTVVRYFDEIFWEINQGYAIDFLPWLLPFYTKHMNKLSSWSTYIRKFILDRIINTREQNVNIDDHENDFTDALLKSLAEDSTVSRETLLFMLEDFIGGHSAIGNLVMLALGYIAKHPEIGKLIQKEVDIVTDKGKRKIQLDDSEKMPFTVATIYEVLRHSSSPIVPHVATEDVSIAGYGVTKGTIVIINNYKLNTSESYWDNPEQFNPTRFLESVPDSHTKINKYQADCSDSGIENEDSETDIRVQVTQIKKNVPHFLPFSIGKRTCIGQNLVKGFGFMMLASLLQSYDISSRDCSLIKMHKACVALPPDTFSLTLTPRSQ